MAKGKKKKAIELPPDLDDIIAQYIPGKMYVIYSATSDGPDGEPRNNLDEVAIVGKVVLVGKTNYVGSCGPGKDYRSRVLVNPTWLQVAIHANAMIRRTKDFHHCFFDGLYKAGNDEDGVPVYRFAMGS